MFRKGLLKYLVGLCLLQACKSSSPYPYEGTLERLDAALDSIITPGARPELIAEGFDWSEGPLWLESRQQLIFSDVPRDTIFSWSEKEGLNVFLTPSGNTTGIQRGGEMGSNGLLLDDSGRLVLCQHGNRQLAVMDASLQTPAPRYRPLADSYAGRRFNSPNDVAADTAGNFYFTDPPYGLEKGMEDSTKELGWQGVYKVKKDGTVLLLIDSLTRPNGIILLPATGQLIVANSDPEKPYWYRYDCLPNDSLRAAGLFYDARTAAATAAGLPDGLKADSKGNVFASGPGGIWIFDKTGKVLGKIKLNGPASNCALSADERTLYITNDSKVLRLRMR